MTISYRNKNCQGKSYSKSMNVMIACLVKAVNIM